MRTIYKYPIGERTALVLPAGARVRLFHEQRNIPTLWIEQDITQRETEDRTFILVATGAPIPESCRWVGSATFSGGGEVWHCYELLP